jgi:hypothetical protein
MVPHQRCLIQIVRFLTSPKNANWDFCRGEFLGRFAQIPDLKSICGFADGSLGFEEPKPKCPPLTPANRLIMGFCIRFMTPKRIGDSAIAVTAIMGRLPMKWMENDTWLH